MAQTLIEFGRSFILDEAAALRSLTTPVLLSAAAISTEETATNTLVTGAPAGISLGTEMVFPLIKDPGKQNAFALGVTLGRTSNNDVVLPHGSVSRFHAFFMQDRKTGQWRLSDAESSNGTFIGARRLLASNAEPVADGAELRFGEVSARFFLPESFASHLRQKIKG